MLLLALTTQSCASLTKSDPVAPPADLGPLFCDIAQIIPNPPCAKPSTRLEIDAHNASVLACPVGSIARDSAGGQ